MLGLLSRLEGRGAVRHGEEGAAEGPDVDGFGEVDARFDLCKALAGRRSEGRRNGTHVKELWSAERHRAVLGGVVLLEESGRAIRNGDSGGEGRAKVHKDGREAVIGDHDVGLRVGTRQLPPVARRKVDLPA